MKKLDWNGHYIDILKGDQFDPDYLKLNPKAVVQTLVRGYWIGLTCDGTVNY